LVAFGIQTTKLYTFSRGRGIFPQISKAPSGETTDRIKKVRGCRKCDRPPLSPRQVWWGSWVARRL